MPDEEWPLLGGNPLGDSSNVVNLKPPFGLWNGGGPDAAVLPPPRDWLLGNTFCKGFLSSLVAEGGTGKTALRMAQALSVATGRPLTGEKAHQRGKVLYISLEDDADELKRRLHAALQFHGIERDEINDRFWLASPGDDWDERKPISSYTVAYTDRRGAVQIGQFLEMLQKAIWLYSFDLVVIDPFVKLHALDENSNGEMDFVCRVLASIAMQQRIAIDVPHHTSKLADTTSLSNRARGGSAFRDAVRLLYTLSPMTADEASELNIPEHERRSYVRLDPGKINITVPAAKAEWFRLVGQPLGNGNDDHPKGDTVQTVATWDPPDLWAGITIPLANQILDKIDTGLPNGQRYLNAHNCDESRKVWRVVQDFAPDLSDQRAKQVITEWLKRKMIEVRDYDDPIARKPQKGVAVLRRPG